ncbi:hypothetical protein PoB_004786800 [Plakobranchus ocellatus]|uniref:Uncharacterized protein n=1 Tax=Plakobranchus ocellatus TaxID=259542 RepID=A0AAV4BQH5_9GAST|nr:hypothetical protein PoB_004786800 [Plakobranchus ocellatus]
MADRLGRQKNKLLSWLKLSPGDGDASSTEQAQKSSKIIWCPVTGSGNSSAILAQSGRMDVSFPQGFNLKQIQGLVPGLCVYNYHIDRKQHDHLRFSSLHQAGTSVAESNSRPR